MFIDVEDSVFNGILNSKKVTTIEIDRDTPSEINYLFSDGGIIKEKFENETKALEKLEFIADGAGFIATNDNRLVNPMYIQTVKKDVINEKRIEIVLYNGMPVKERFENIDERNSAYEELKELLESLSEGGGGGGEGAEIIDSKISTTSTWSSYKINRELNKLKEIIDSQKESIEAQQEVIEEQEETIKEQQRNIAQKEDYIQSQNEEINALNSTLEDVGNKVENINGEEV